MKLFKLFISQYCFVVVVSEVVVFLVVAVDFVVVLVALVGVDAVAVAFYVIFVVFIGTYVKGHRIFTFTDFTQNGVYLIVYLLFLFCFVLLSGACIFYNKYFQNYFSENYRIKDLTQCFLHRVQV